jgi:broad specificity polyphosphatase/5'/3'-nucleotidase SurE
VGALDFSGSIPRALLRDGGKDDRVRYPGPGGASSGALFGKYAIAFSQYRRQGIPIDWPTAGTMTARVLETLRHRDLEPGAFWNVNLPEPDREGDPPEIVCCPLDHSQLPVD